MHLDFGIQNELVLADFDQMSSGLHGRLGPDLDIFVSGFLLVVIVTIHFFVQLLKLNLSLGSLSSLLISGAVSLQLILGFIKSKLLSTLLGPEGLLYAGVMRAWDRSHSIADYVHRVIPRLPCLVDCVWHCSRDVFDLNMA